MEEPGFSMVFSERGFMGYLEMSIARCAMLLSVSTAVAFAS
jgi:hypothetical protein